MPTILDFIKEEVPSVLTVFVTDTRISRHILYGLDYIGKYTKKDYSAVDPAVDTIAILSFTEQQALIYYMEYAVCIQGSGSTTSQADKVTIKDDYNTVTRESTSSTGMESAVDSCEDWKKKIDDLFQDDNGGSQAFFIVDTLRKA